jgi:assimilatory nitrate reductase catalytic subunit
MVVCSCRRVTDRAVTAAIADGAVTLDAIAGHCAAGSRCGGCWPELERLIAQTCSRLRADARVPVSASA